MLSDQEAGRGSCVSWGNPVKPAICVSRQRNARAEPHMNGQVNRHRLRPSGGLSKALWVTSVTSCSGPGQLPPSVG